MRNHELEMKWEISEQKLDTLLYYIDNISELNNKKILISGNDKFYLTKTGSRLRVRFSQGRTELTVKQNLGDDLTLRREINLLVNGNNQDIHEFMDILGLDQDIVIFKNCAIYYGNNVVVSLYIASSKGGNQRYFLEIESEGLNQERGLEKIQQVINLLDDPEIQTSTRINKDLYTIFKELT